MKKKPYATEADLCADFIAVATADKTWTAYAEHGGWDILLVRNADGFQIGVEAKLTLNNKVVCQALPDGYFSFAETGPDCRAVLVPHEDVQNGLSTICAHIGLTVLRLRPPSEWGSGSGRDRLQPYLPRPAGRWDSMTRDWHEWCPVNRVKLPDYVPDVAAGASAPVRLTDWKIAAIKLCIILEERPVSRADFKALRLDPRRWTQWWLQSTPEGYVRCKDTPDLKAQHPVVWEQIKAEAEKWMPPALKKPADLFSAGTRNPAPD